MKALPTQFQEDREFVEAVVEKAPYSTLVDLIPYNIQRLFPDLVVKAITTMDALFGREDQLAPELWSNLEVCKAWFSCRFVDVPSRLPQSMKDNQELGLVIAKSDHENHVFRVATSDAIRSNKSFMTKAVQSNALRFNEAHVSLRHDFELAVTAFGCESWRNLVASGYLQDDRNRNFLRRVLNDAQEKVYAHERFVAGLLFGMSNSAGPGCRLRMIANDAETSLALKRTIASFLGVPMGKELSILRQAVGNIREELGP